ncbi:S-adenosyl-L-methionine-dependent methyltransferase [Crucibulum laeve]|uniref:tRNA (cytosine(38)-C(5))-methyltransferase n=1 Tax=Crucibulum laeve TaxID=68775 RepID=A0A5C3M1G3_9AGAR|nr:S-adenosyl-L-methionine-dependent methyltransferase [Crucibulum laeve]
MPVRAAEFYSGIGGLHLAFTRSGVEGSVVQAFDWDQNACQVYLANHYPNIVKKVDITTLTATQLASLGADLWLLSPACQPYTVLNRNAKGASDPRAQSFLHLMLTVLPEMAAANTHPDRLLVENVAGFETSSTRQITVSTLRSLGYSTLELLLTPLQFGIPNSRLRYYLLAKKTPLSFLHVLTHNRDAIWRHIPGQMPEWIDPRSESELGSFREEEPAPRHEVRALQDYLDETQAGASSPYTVSDKVLQKWGRLFDIVLPSSRRTCCFTRGYTQLVERAGSIIQMNEELDTTEIFNKFLQAQSNSEDEAVKFLHPLQLRYFSPEELLRIFEFNPLVNDSTYTSQFKWPEDISTKSKYRLIGNSVNVRVVQALIEYLFLEE